MSRTDCAVIGGGAAGFLAAITCAEADPGLTVRLCEAAARPLGKVAISGGGRCNVTHACFDPKDLAAYYPRGGRELLGPFHRWQPRDTVEWFVERGVPLKTEEDGRIFPMSDDSATVVDCLLAEAVRAGVRWAVRESAIRIEHVPDAKVGPEFRIELAGGASFTARRVLLATGGGKDSAGLKMAASLGHTIESPVPSLFAFNISDSRLRGLAGVSVPDASVRLGGHIQSRGPLLITHLGLSGPGILKLSAWGARELAACGYHFEIEVCWAGGRSRAEIRKDLDRVRSEHPKRQISSGNPFGIPSRLWERLTGAAGIPASLIWSSLSKSQAEALAAELGAGKFRVDGKSMNKEEFVTCGGVRLSEVDFKTMESKLCPGLFFAGEVLDIDGLTGGFNLQSAWTTGRLAGWGMTSHRPPAA